MPLTLLGKDETGKIKRIGGRDKVRRFLENLGLVTGEQVRIVSANEGNLILQIRDSRVAISKDIANKIIV